MLSQFWRAPVDNDLGWQAPLRLRMWRAASLHKRQALLNFRLVSQSPRGACVFSSWRVASGHLLSARGRGRFFNAERAAARLAAEGDRCGLGANQTCVSCLYSIISPVEPPGGQKPGAAAGGDAPSVRVECRYLPGVKMRAGMPSMPRFGLSVALRRQLAHMAWHGLGPHETYADRLAAAKVGVYQGSVSSMLHPYLRPQESGNKVGVRWLALSESAKAVEGTQAGGGIGLLFTTPRGAPPRNSTIASATSAASSLHALLSASAHHFATADLDLASAEDAQIVSSHHVTKKHEVQKHAAELVERELTELHLDAAQMGVGGVHSWGAMPDEQHMLRPDRSYRLQFEVRPFDVAGTLGGPAGRVGGGAGREDGLVRLSALAAAAGDVQESRDADPSDFRCEFPGEEFVSDDGISGHLAYQRDFQVADPAKPKPSDAQRSRAGPGGRGRRAGRGKRIGKHKRRPKD